MKQALQKLAEIMGDPKIAERNPLSSLSFSCLAPEVVKSQSDSLAFYRKGLDRAYLPLGPDGRPIRRYVYIVVPVSDIFSHHSLPFVLHPYIRFAYLPSNRFWYSGFLDSPSARRLTGSMAKKTEYHTLVRRRLFSLGLSI